MNARYAHTYLNNSTSHKQTIFTFMFKTRIQTRMDTYIYFFYFLHNSIRFCKIVLLKANNRPTCKRKVLQVCSLIIITGKWKYE